MIYDFDKNVARHCLHTISIFILPLTFFQLFLCPFRLELDSMHNFTIISCSLHNKQSFVYTAFPHFSCKHTITYESRIILLVLADISTHIWLQFSFSIYKQGHFKNPWKSKNFKFHKHILTLYSIKYNIYRTI